MSGFWSVWTLELDSDVVDYVTAAEMQDGVQLQYRTGGCLPLMLIPLEDMSDST
ncbi:hypothetical protein ACLOJK_010873 [Asimina triloba]